MKKAAFLAACALLCAPSAYAQQPPPCGPRGDIVKELTGKYQEVPYAFGTVNGQVIFELFVSAKGTWTAMTTNNEGITCLMAAGQDFEPQKVEPPKPGQGT